MCVFRPFFLHTFRLVKVLSDSFSLQRMVAQYRQCTGNGKNLKRIQCVAVFLNTLLLSPTPKACVFPSYVARAAWRSGKACAARTCTSCRAAVAKLTTT